MAESDDTVEHLGSEAEFRVRDMRLYDTALDNSQISQIGLAEGVRSIIPPPPAFLWLGIASEARLTHGTAGAGLRLPGPLYKA